MKQSERFFFELLQVAIDNRTCLSATPTPEGWEEIQEICKKQTVVGIGFVGVKRLPEEQLPPRSRIRQWLVKVIKIEEKNKQVSSECQQVSARFKHNGFYSCILKGQSLLKYYPEHLRMLRTPGDVDVWMRPNKKIREKFADHRKSWIERFLLLDDFYTIGRYVKSVSRDMDDIVYHHFHCNILPKNMVEVHITPAFFMNPFKNRRLQRLFDDQWKLVQRENSKDNDEGFYSMPIGINIIFLISHFYRHLILEGIGMRQLMDICFAIKCFVDKCDSEDIQEEANIHCQLTSTHRLMREIDRLGMHDITSGIMWMMRECLGMKEEYLLCTPSEKYGKHLLEEMMKGGNFGRSSKGAEEMYSGETSAVRFWRSCKYGMRLMKYYPGETLWVPFNNAKQSIIKNYFRKHPL